jgi:transcriptional regulator GlxA family with amidase domain
MIVNRPDLSVDEISLAVGFESSTYFRRVFKLITGKNPRDYRKLKTGI